MAVATVGMVADLVREIGGDRVEVVQIMGSGVDPHLYKTTRDDVRELMRGDLIFYSGLMLEGKMTDTLEKIGRTKPVYAVTERIRPEYLLEPEDSAGHSDPHVWMDVSAWAQCIVVVAQALSEYDPEHAEEYTQAAARYAAELEELHRYGQERIASVPAERRLLITSHDAFNYFGRAYDLEVVGVQGLSTESEAGLQQINRLVDLIVDREVQAVFVESSVPRKNIESLIDGARSRGHEVVIGSELYSDAMGPEGTYEGTYIGMLDHNITRVARALGGQAPDRGLRGQLRPAGASPENSSAAGEGEG
ncbi:metal ABC transporter solute-binding protein, Zn/Mn family [Candidatus Laterigemmans baculatus]|uniref:metal ABC transporter solute-binding protein, Zn/Mn family n=1 Tax=Candidatus Laterigemmans baculatus TaxID=2770505 RepID=UPI001F2F102D|nr:zinc ABC transporter substrate-binding protein [Candidatus Laterigemmans baculatus]